MVVHKLVLNRIYMNDATLGILSISGRDNPVFFTIERPWVNNERGISCIPKGTYEVHPYSSTKYTDVWEVQDVPNRSKILIHWANWAHDLEGCIAIGKSMGYMKYDNQWLKAVTSSRDAIKDLKNEIGYPSAFDLEVV